MLLRRVALALVLLTSCGDKRGDTDGAETGTTDLPTASTEPASTGSTSADPATDGTTSTSATDSPTGEATGESALFDRFTLYSAAGPCPPDSDCNGFVELLSTRILRVEKFGEVGDPVTEVEISADDFAAAVVVLADPELAALLISADPLCDPPTDVYEMMEQVLGGEIRASTTTGCDQPPVEAARMTMNALREQYAP